MEIFNKNKLKCKILFGHKFKCRVRYNLLGILPNKEVWLPLKKLTLWYYFLKFKSQRPGDGIIEPHNGLFL